MMKREACKPPERTPRTHIGDVVPSKGHERVLVLFRIAQRKLGSVAASENERARGPNVGLCAISV